MQDLKLARLYLMDTTFCVSEYLGTIYLYICDIYTEYMNTDLGFGSTYSKSCI